jgi:hypothetical protein
LNAQNDDVRDLKKTGSFVNNNEFSFQTKEKEEKKKLSSKAVQMLNVFK